VSAAQRSRRALGWHRLADEWAARIVAAAGVRPGELVLDIGAGEGALTAHLVHAGARVVAVELNPRRASMLRERFPGITVVQADAVSIPLPGRPFRVVANPPYGISSSLLRTLLAPGSRLFAADLVLQRAVVRKFASGCAPRFSLTLGMTLPRRAFLPPPRVDSAVLVIRRQGRAPSAHRPDRAQPASRHRAADRPRRR
jgi:23S rRNA (adenine-N6)-dimethyltransferase